MTQIKAIISGIGAYLPEYILDNFELSRMVDTSDEWIMQRVGIKERRILKGEGKSTSYMAAEAVNQLLKRTNTKPEDIELLICATITGDLPFPATANIVCEKTGLKNAFSFDISAACSGFIFALETARRYIESGGYKKVIVIGADMMSSITDYTDRTTCPLFGDAAAAVLLEPVLEDIGIIDSILGVDGAGVKHLHLKAGGSLYPISHKAIDEKENRLHQDGQVVFKAAVSKMSDNSLQLMKQNNLTAENLNWFVPHQANMRIIEAVGRRMNLNADQVMKNIDRYGNTTAATIPLCLWDYENKLKKGVSIILSAFGAGFTWGSIYIKWAYSG